MASFEPLSVLGIATNILKILEGSTAAHREQSTGRIANCNALLSHVTASLHPDDACVIAPLLHDCLEIMKDAKAPGRVHGVIRAFGVAEPVDKVKAKQLMAKVSTIKDIVQSRQLVRLQSQVDALKSLTEENAKVAMRSLDSYEEALREKAETKCHLEHFFQENRALLFSIKEMVAGQNQMLDPLLSKKLAGVEERLQKTYQEQRGQTEEQYRNARNEEETRRKNIDELRSSLRNVIQANSVKSPLHDNICCQPFVIPPLPSPPATAGEAGAPSSPTAGQVTLDSGCRDNWIHLEMVRRAGLSSHVAPLWDGDNDNDGDDDADNKSSYGEGRHVFRGFGGQLVKPLGRIEVTWYSVNQSRTKRNMFWVSDQVPFDALLGLDWIMEESGTLFDQPALALRHVKLAPEQLRVMAENAKAKGASKGQMLAIRNVEAAARRQKNRENRAATRGANTPMLGTGTATPWTWYGTATPMTGTPGTATPRMAGAGVGSYHNNGGARSAASSVSEELSSTASGSTRSVSGTETPDSSGSEAGGPVVVVHHCH